MPSNTQTLLVRYAALGAAFSVTLVGALGAQTTPKAAPARGEQIFAQQCAACHGAQGEGTQAFNRPLAGDRSVGELAEYIAKYMPPGAPKKLPAEDARAVAAYIYDAFYSPIARERNRPARIELSRLTVRQYRNTLADLLGSFRQAGAGAAILDGPRGLRAEYFKSRNLRNEERALERVDPDVQFDFQTAAPAPEIDPRQFSIRWQGSVVAPETGEYEFIVRTEHAARLWVNDARTPLVDAWVKSGSDKEYRASLFLLGGRAYPLRLEFSKSKQGVDDSDKQKDKPPAPAAITLAWRLPKRADEPVPARCLIPVSAPETFVVTAPFPPDDRSLGYERGTSISKAWDEATTTAAIETAGYVAARLNALAGTSDEAPDRAAKIQAFCRRFVERAFRRPLDADVARLYVDRQIASAPDAETGVRRVVLLALKSPRFLFREVAEAEKENAPGAADPYAVASRLAFTLWDSLPDDVLLQAAAGNALATRTQIAGQAERMAADPRAWAKLQEFLLQWLKVEQIPELVKDKKRYPAFDEQVASDLRTSLELTLASVVRSERSDLRELLQTDKVFLNGRLARIYGAGLVPDAPFQPVAMDYGKRAGILTHPYLLASFAYVDGSSPIHRGVLIARNVLGRTLQPPPQAFAPLAADLHPGMTTRQRVTLQTKPAACVSCHSLINPLGFPLEKFDAIGRIRAREGSQPVDARGSYLARDGKRVTFAGPDDLARYLAGSDDAHAAFVEKLFQNLTHQPVRAYGTAALTDLQKTFTENQFNIREQMVASAVVSALGPQMGTIESGRRADSGARSQTRESSVQP